MKRLAPMIAAIVLIGAAAPAFAATETGEHAAPPPPHINWTTGLFDLSHQSKDAEGGELEPGDHPMNPPFLAVLINFTIFVGLLVWKGGPPITRYLKRRHEDVKGALDEAARMQAEAAAVLAERAEKLGAVDAEVDELIAGMKRDADSEKQRMIAEAETASAALKRDADDRIAATAVRARLAIEGEVIAAAVEAAESLIREHATDEDHNALVERFIESLEAGGSPTPPAAVDEGWS